MGTCSKISKVGLIIFNVLFLAAGLAVLAAGIYYYVEGQTYGIPQTFAIGTIITAIVVILFAILGLVGAILINKILLWIYFVLLLLLLGGEIAVAVVAYEDYTNLVTFLGNEYRGLTIAEQFAIENTFLCCGFYNNTDSPANGTCCQYYANITGVLGPDNVTVTTPSPTPLTEGKYTCVLPPSQGGCYAKYVAFYDTYIVYLEAGAGVLAGIEIFGMIFAIALAVQADEAAKDMEMDDYK